LFNGAAGNNGIGQRQGIIASTGNSTKIFFCQLPGCIANTVHLPGRFYPIQLVGHGLHGIHAGKHNGGRMCHHFHDIVFYTVGVYRRGIYK
jgi:hypothetical protein